MSLSKAQESAIKKLKAQQAKEKQYSPVYGVAEQLMDICRNEIQSAELLDKDLDNPEMSIKRAEKQIREFADKLHEQNGGNGVFVPPSEADRILREFYGLPEANPQPVADLDKNWIRIRKKSRWTWLDLMDFLRGD